MAKAGLSETLAGPGMTSPLQIQIFFLSWYFIDILIWSELTIWAPTNEAIAASDLKSIYDVNQLKNVLSYHLVSFKNDPKEISSIQYELSVPTLQGEVVRISVYRKKGVSFAVGEVKY